MRAWRFHADLQEAPLLHPLPLPPPPIHHLSFPLPSLLLPSTLPLLFLFLAKKILLSRAQGGERQEKENLMTENSSSPLALNSLSFSSLFLSFFSIFLTNVPHPQHLTHKLRRRTFFFFSHPCASSFLSGEFLSRDKRIFLMPQII